MGARAVLLGFIRPEIIGDPNQQQFVTGAVELGNVMPQPVFNGASANPSAKPSVRFVVPTVPPNRANVMKVRAIKVPEKSPYSACLALFVGLHCSYSGEAM